jgi:hypothetical protein
LCLILSRDPVDRGGPSEPSDEAGEQNGKDGTRHGSAPERLKASLWTAIAAVARRLNPDIARACNAPSANAFQRVVE